jgi:signal transduction histidine kinase
MRPRASIISQLLVFAALAERLRVQEAEHSRLRAGVREAGLRIQEHLAADNVLREAEAAVRQNLAADIVYLRLVEDGKPGRLARSPGELAPIDEALRRVPPRLLNHLGEYFRTQRSLVCQDVQGDEGERMGSVYSQELLDLVRRRGVHSLIVAPFGVGADLLGTIVVMRITPGRPWTEAEVDALESIAADLGRGLRNARLYEAENRLVCDLKALDAAKSEFFTTVSHELRSPLTTIDGYLELLSDGDADPLTERQRAMVETIGRSATRLRYLIDDVFTLAKVESGAFAVTIRPLAVAELVAGSVAAVRPSATAGKLTLTCSEPPPGLMVSGDAGQLERALINLLSNAVKFTAAGGKVTVRTVVDEGWAVITVSDTGIGVPERDQKELFTRFYRASNAVNRRIPGTGLGLAIVRMIVTNHGGEVGLESRENEGTTVAVRLPLVSQATSLLLAGLATAAGTACACVQS